MSTSPTALDREHRLVCSLGKPYWRPTLRRPLRRVWISECKCDLNAGTLEREL